MPDIRFHNRERWDLHGWVYFEAYVISTPDKPIGCRISSEALQDRLEAARKSESDLIAAFRQNRPRIERIAESLIKAARYETDGSILIRKEDVN